ncbi:MAG TPA: tRNA pseudouridine(38-40) synthase TruA [Streptosporangiaceae bacterium]|jgi:tRNA pseudouridine38-40 synthase|nr:tRNA pseudouridine(38-40) synthase TruA [Streptosporangiaceae bacterium]
MTRSAEPDPGICRIRLDLSYDGAGFHGWASQPGLRTVQDEVERALATMLGLPAVRLTVAGRTDTGVHARGQVAHTDVPAAQWLAAQGLAAQGLAAQGPATGGPVLRRLAGLLPPDVRVRAIGPAPDGFDARFSALWRRYSYRVCDESAAADPLRRGDTLFHPRPLDVSLMNQAAAALAGEHDFAAFCRRREGASTVRALLRLDWQRTAPGLAVATVVADAFCHNMVRALTGALLAVGDGRKPPGWPAGVLAARVRDPAVHVAPAHALCLEEVCYPAPGELAARAAATRRVRGQC